MRNIYLDQNALINACDRARGDHAFRSALRDPTPDGHCRIVLSAWHWVETSRARDVGRAAELADFMDGLSPGWLRDRRDLERIEVEERFYRFVGVEYSRPQAIITRAELAAAVSGLPRGRKINDSSREIVTVWIKNPAPALRLERSHRQNAQALMRLRAARAAGKVTGAVIRKGDREHIRGFLPDPTAGGVVLDESTEGKFLDRVAIKDLPTLAAEAAITEYLWSSEGKTGWRHMVDRNHLISALPHVDAVVTDDKDFPKILRAAEPTGPVTARLSEFQEFC